MNGLLLIDKAEGMTSMDVVRRVRRAVAVRRVGHTGTLDPLATGLLPVTIGACTKFPKFLSLDPKVYTFEMVLGVETDSGDDEGTRLGTGRTDVSAEEIEAVLPRFVGEIDQIPPRFSAVRIGGQRAYERARKGEDFEIPSRRVRIHRLELGTIDDGVASLEVECDGGTYVRSLAQDIAVAAGTVAYARSIRRLRVGPWSIDDAVTVAELQAAPDPWDHVWPPRRMVESLPSLELDDEEHRRVTHGNRIFTSVDVGREFVALLHEGVLVAVSEVLETSEEGSVLQPRRVISD